MLATFPDRPVCGSFAAGVAKEAAAVKLDGAVLDYSAHWPVLENEGKERDDNPVLAFDADALPKNETMGEREAFFETLVKQALFLHFTLADNVPNLFINEEDIQK